ncbi:MAG: trigger factor [Spirochaetes bacterium]|nr:MAG: trigger factor [Spirochaetota bacterium]
MIISEKKLENARMEITLEVPENRVELEYKSVLDKIKNNAKLDGFRRGKAPLEVIERKFMEAADQEVAENLLKSTYLDAVTEKSYRPIAPPEFTFDKVSRGQGFKFSAVFETIPTVEMVSYKGVGAKERSCEVTDADVMREIDSLRERNATVSKKEDGAVVEKGDFVKIKVKRIDDVDPAEADKVEFKEYSIIVGKDKDEGSFDDALKGMKTEELKEVKMKYSKDYSVKELAGQTARYILGVTEVNKLILPALDDDFAKDLGEYSTLDDLKKKMRENLETYVSQKAKSEAKGQLMKEIVTHSTFDIPNSLLEKEMFALFKKVQERTGYTAQNINEFAAALGLNAEDFEKQLREEAQANVKSTLVLSEIGFKEELKVPEEKFREFVELLARRYNKPVEELLQTIEQNGSRESIESELLLDTALDFIYINATISKQKKVSLQEFMKGE